MKKINRGKYTIYMPESWYNQLSEESKRKVDAEIKKDEEN